MATDSFYLTLVSTASMNVFPDNKQSHFKVQLPAPISLDGDWHVGLAEAFLPQAWDNISEEYLYFNAGVHDYDGDTWDTSTITFKEDEISGSDYDAYTHLVRNINQAIPPDIASSVHLYIAYSDDNEKAYTALRAKNGYEIQFPQELGFILGFSYMDWIKNRFTFPDALRKRKKDNVISIDNTNNYFYIRKRPDPKRPREITLQIQPGQYKRIEEVIDAMNKVIPIEHTGNIKITLLPDGRVHVKCGDNYYVCFSKKQPGLGRLLGFHEEQLDLSLQDIAGYSVADIDRGTASLYIYTNLILPQVVGDVYAPLLRVLPMLNDKSSSLAVHRFQNIDYYPLRCPSFEMIEIDMRTDYGENIMFKLNKSVIKLHFMLKHGTK